VLVDLAEVLLKVEELEIYVDSSSALLKSLPDNPPQFGKLKKLSFGTSPLRKEDWFEIQVFQERILPWDCELIEGLNICLLEQHHINK